MMMSGAYMHMLRSKMAIRRSIAKMGDFVNDKGDRFMPIFM